MGRVGAVSQNLGTEDFFLRARGGRREKAGVPPPTG